MANEARELIAAEPTDYGWLLTEPLYVQALTDSSGEFGKRVLARDTGARWAVVLTVTEVPGDEPGRLTVLLNGDWVDLGDDFPVVLGIVDAAYDWPGEVYLEPEN